MPVSLARCHGQLLPLEMDGLSESPGSDLGNAGLERSWAGWGVGTVPTNVGTVPGWGTRGTGCCCARVPLHPVRCGPEHHVRGALSITGGGEGGP